MEVLVLLNQAVLISFLVFVMMLLVDFVDHATQQRITAVIQSGCLRQYTLASFLGSTPGCLGAFMNVSLYVHGIISFGAIVGGMIATSGDEAFVMLVQFPRTALVLFALLFACGVIFAWVADKLVLVFRLTPTAYCTDHQCEQCRSVQEQEEVFSDAFSATSILDNFRRLSFARFLLISLVAGLLILLMTGTIGPPSWNWKRVAFTALAAFQWFYAFAARTTQISVFSAGLFSNRWVVLGVASAIALQLLAIYTPFGQNVFHTAPLTLGDWSRILTVSSSIFVLDETLKFFGVYRTATKSIDAVPLRRPA